MHVHSASRATIGVAWLVGLLSGLAGCGASSTEVANLARADRPAASARERQARSADTAAVPFTAQQVLELAQRLAASPPRARGTVAPELAALGYDQYRDLRFREEYASWTGTRSNFRLDLLPAGFIYAAPVAVSLVEEGLAREIRPQAGMFDVGPRLAPALGHLTVPLSGLRLRTRLNSRAVWDEFVVFQGASYFRAVGRGQGYGLSARGLALHTAQPQGEEFPAFTQLWVETPAPRATAVVVHALLESASLTGAYTFVIRPGQDTTMDVSFTLFPRVPLRNVGIAPLTSMFLFDGTNRSRFDDVRLRVHDSDGLLVHTRGGERLWRPLANPRSLQISSFTEDAPLGFGLLQRARLLAEYQDLEAGYERRPSAWVELGDGFGAGQLKLVEIPTARESNDNIVVFFEPRDELPAGRPYSGQYRISWTADALLEHPLGRVVASHIGSNIEGTHRLVALDIVGLDGSPDDYALEVSASAGQVRHPVLQANPAVRGLRATFELDPAGAPLIELRARVRKGAQPASETWLYRWTAG